MSVLIKKNNKKTVLSQAEATSLSSPPPTLSRSPLVLSLSLSLTLSLSLSWSSIHVGGGSIRRLSFPSRGGGGVNGRWIWRQVLLDVMWCMLLFLDDYFMILWWLWLIFGGKEWLNFIFSSDSNSDWDSGGGGLQRRPSSILWRMENYQSFN